MNYLKTQLVNNKFICQLTANFEHEADIEIDVIIDTGCQHSLISADLFYVFWQDEEKEKMQEKVRWMQKRKSGIGRGVESMNKVINKIISPSNPNVSITQNFYDLHIGDINVGDKQLRVSYDTSMVALIGMEILKDWDMHISKSLKTGKTTLLACPLDKINQSYIDALIEEFDIGQRMIKQIVDKIDYKALEAHSVSNQLKQVKYEN